MKELKRMNSFAALNWIYAYVSQYKLWFALSVSATGALIAINLAQAWFIKRLVDRTLTGDISSLPGLLTMFLAILAIGTALNFLRTRATGQFSESSIRDIRNQLGEKISALSFSALGEIQAGDMASRLNNDTETVGRFMKKDLPGIAMHILMGLAAAVYIGTLSWRLLAASLTITPPTMLLAYWLNSKAGKHYPVVYEMTGKAAGELEQSILGREVIRSYTLQNLFSNKFRTMYQDIFRAEMQAQKYVAILQPVCFALVYMPRLFCVLYGGYLVYSGEMEVGTVVAVLQLLEHIIAPTVMLPFFMNNIKRSLAAAQRVAAVFELPQERGNGAPITGSPHPEPIRFSTVSFSYPQGEKVLDNVSFSLRQGTVTALVGISGSGKTTITRLVTGLLECSNGTIELFGSRIKSLSLKAIRKELAVVSQHNYLFPGTIAENIGYGSPQADMEQIVIAAQSAYAHDFICTMPQGYETMVGEGGTSLSGGQRQRIAIARAILRDAPIVILDEPTSALDKQAEAIIRKSISRLTRGKTVLVVAHRLSTIKEADEIIVLNSGRIVEKGSHAELIERRGYYYNLYRAQLSA